MSLGRRLKAAFYSVEGRVIDRHLGITTQGCASGAGGQGAFADSVSFTSKSYLLLSAVLSRVNIGPADTFYDVGSGLGRVLFLVAWRKRPLRCIGIELLGELCRASRENARRFAKRFPDRGRVIVQEADAVQADYAGGTVYFAFNPFGEQTFSAVLEKIGHDLRRKPRQATFVYLNALHPEVFHRNGWSLTQAKRVLGSPLETMYFSKAPGLGLSGRELPEISRALNPQTSESRGSFAVPPLTGRR